MCLSAPAEVSCLYFSVCLQWSPLEFRKSGIRVKVQQLAGKEEVSKAVLEASVERRASEMAQQEFDGLKGLFTAVNGRYEVQ